MDLNLIEIYKLGWPVLTVLLVFSMVALAIFLQSWAIIKQLRGMIQENASSLEPGHLDFYFDVLSKRLAILGTIANAAPFVGLLGTVMGIIRAFHSISLSSGGGISTVAGGISEALFATAMGLAVAIPASMGFNFFTFHMQSLAKKADIDV